MLRRDSYVSNNMYTILFFICKKLTNLIKCTQVIRKSKFYIKLYTVLKV